jgi:hypothetical protein
MNGEAMSAILLWWCAVCLSGLVLPASNTSSCLPKDIKPADVVSAQMKTPGREGRKVTVEEKLKEMKARCKRGKLVDATGKEIRFYRLTGCWGNPPADYQEILNRQNSELESLRKRYRVIEMTCNPSGELIL